MRTETLPSSRWSEPPTKITPEKQLLDIVTPFTVALVLLRTRMPKFRNCWTRPGPRMATSFRALTKIPASPDAFVIGKPGLAAQAT